MGDFLLGELGARGSLPLLQVFLGRLGRLLEKGQDLEEPGVTHHPTLAPLTPRGELLPRGPPRRGGRRRPVPSVSGQMGQHSPSGISALGQSAVSSQITSSQRMLPLSQTQIWQGSGFHTSLSLYVRPSRTQLPVWTGRMGRNVRAAPRRGFSLTLPPPLLLFLLLLHPPAAAPAAFLPSSGSHQR